MAPLRVCIVTQNDPIYIPHFFREFFRILPRDRIKIISVDLNPALNRRQNPLKFLKRIVAFFGIVGTIKVSVEQVFRRINSKLVSPSFESPLSWLCYEHNILYRRISDVNSMSYLREIEAAKPDILLSVSGAQIFRPELLLIPRLGAINVHTGRLPKYRGMMPVFWQVLNRESDIVISVHTMASKLDSGKLIHEHKVPVGEIGSLSNLIKTCKKEGARAAMHVLDLYLADDVNFSPFSQSDTDYYSFPSRKDVRQLTSRGWVIR